jgi:hypothetical protein
LLFLIFLNSIIENQIQVLQLSQYEAELKIWNSLQARKTLVTIDSETKTGKNWTHRQILKP